MDIHDLEIQVNDVYLDDKLNFNSLYTNITLVVCDRLKALPICLNSLFPDLLTWKGNLDYIYTSLNIYNLLNRREFFQNTTDNNSWK